MQERLPAARLIGRGILPGHGLHFHKRSVDESGKCSILAAGTGVHVAVYELSAGDKRLLDEIEGVGRGYEVEIVDVPGFSDCATYRAETSYVDDRLTPYDWYRELVLLGCRYHGFPGVYVDRLASLEVRADPDPVRSEANRQLIERIRAA
jgi:hypothetical protein